MQDRKPKIINPEVQEPKGVGKVIEPAKDLASGVRDHTCSFALGAVPSTIASTVVAGAYSVFSGIGGAIGLSGFAKAAGGVLGTAVTIGPVAAVSMVFGTAAVGGLAMAADKVPFVRDADFKDKSIIAGALAGPFLAYAMISGGDEALEVPVEEPTTPVLIEESASLNREVSNENFDASAGLDQAYLIKQNTAPQNVMALG